VVAVSCVTDADQLMLVTEQGKILRMGVGDLRLIGRNAQGVRLMDMDEGDRVVSVARLSEKENETEADAEPERDPQPGPAEGGDADAGDSDAR
jgi:DNA gyrase subunit A